MAIISDIPERQPDLNTICNMVAKSCNTYLMNTVGVGWYDLADNTCVEDFVCEDFFDNDTETQEHIIKDICWDKLDLDGTIYMAMSYEQLKNLIYGED